ncbi:MAG: flagellar hook-associated protein FlgL [Desulfonatronovibrio sp.]
MRISLNMLYDNFVSNMNKSTYKLMELNKMASSQKKINKPSDDPVGAGRVLDYRDSIASLKQYESNVDTAKGWLGQADETLMQVNNVLIRAKEIAEQGATGTLDAEQREILSFEARQLFDQMINLANTRFDGKSIFGGHKVDESAYEPAMSLTSNKDLPDEFTIEGKTSGTILVQFTTSAEVNDGDDINYRYSTDGGKSFTDKTLDAGETELDLDGVLVDLPSSGYTVEANDPDNTNDSSGTWLWVRPTAEYKGDDADQHTVEPLYAQDINSGDVTATGSFDKDITVRIDEVEGNSPGDNVTYSYSQDGGSNWTTGNEAEVDADDNVRFLVPGGRIDIEDIGDSSNLNDNDQILIRPNRAAIDFEISANQNIQVNSVGKDIFGGVYQKPGEDFLSADPKGAENIFETLGSFIGYLETNNQSGIQQSLEDINSGLEHTNKQLAAIGAKENRLNVSENMLSGLVLNETERLSKVEDVDMSKLMTDLVNQQIIYESVLKSSSTIMRMSLVNQI